jgi:Uncharacterised nucleotidyltransferase
MTSTLSPLKNSTDQSVEISLLLLCSRTHLDPTQIDRLQQLVQQPLDWSTLLTIAQEHGLMPLLYSHLSRYGSAAVPTDILEQLQASHHQNFQKNLRLTTELLKIVQCLETNNIPVLCFKGPTLAQLAYGNLALREFTDLDLLIPESAVLQTTHLLISQGYTPQYSLTDQEIITYARLRNEQAFWHEEKQVEVDLHWSVLPKYYSFSPDSAMFWADQDHLTFANQTVATLSREHLLLFLCAHGAKHNWSHLGWICDVVELLRVSPNLNWQKVQQLSSQLGTPHMLFLGLYLAHHLLDATVPPSLLASLTADASILPLAQQVEHWLFEPPSNLRLLQHNTMLNRNLTIYLKTFDSPKDLIWFWIDTILVPTPLEWQIVALPQTLSFLYYPIRLIRLVLKRF